MVVVRHDASSMDAARRTRVRMMRCNIMFVGLARGTEEGGVVMPQGEAKAPVCRYYILSIHTHLFFLFLINSIFPVIQ